MVGRKKETTTMQLSDLRMAPHKQQQQMIVAEMLSARRKLEEENQKLRDELSDAQMFIKFLQQKIENQEKILKKNVRSSSSGRSLEASSRLCKSTNQCRRKATTTWKEAFTNPVAPGRKTFEAATASTDAKRRTKDREDKGSGKGKGSVADSVTKKLVIKQRTPSRSKGQTTASTLGKSMKPAIDDYTYSTATADVYFD